MQWKNWSIQQRIIAMLGTFFFLLVLNWIGLLQPILNIASPVVTPITKQVDQLAHNLGQFHVALVSLGQVRQHNIVLQKQTNELLAENARLTELEHENIYLRQQLDLQQSKTFDLVPATIIGKQPTNFIQFLIIDQGTAGGIEKGMPVVSSEGLLVGQILSVQQHTAKVLIITDGDSVVPAKVQLSRADGVVRGQSFGYGLTLDFVPLDVQLEVNTIVITSGLGDSFPKGLFIGVISDVEKNPSEVFQKASIRPQVNFNQLEMVAVIKNFIKEQPTATPTTTPIIIEE